MFQPINKCLWLLVAIPFLIPLTCQAGQYRVLRVIEGDTIDIWYRHKTTRIRMRCVDTPDPDQPSRYQETGRQALAYTKSRLSGKSVDLEFERSGRKGGAYVIVDGKNFNLELVRMGWSAYVTRNGRSERYHTEFAAAEKDAKTRRLNIWKGGAPRLPDLEGLSCKLVRGNVKSKKFHKPECPSFNCENCIRAFPDRHEALKAGFVPCSLCRP